MESSNHYNLIKKVIDSSVSDTWEEAVKEWKISDCTEDETVSSECICGHKGIRYLYTIENTNNGDYLTPIGSKCIEKFERSDLSEELEITEGLFKLFHAVEKNERIELTSHFFTRKLLNALYEKGAFISNKYNDFNGFNDYQFLLQMYNKRNKSEITELQKKKITAIILNSIKPYLRKNLKFKR